MKRKSATLLVLAAIIVGLGIDAFWIEPASLRVVHHEVAIAEAGRAGIDALHIAVISDLHAGAPYIDDAKIRRVVELANDAKPDLILLAGDYVTRSVLGGRRYPIERLAAFLKPLHAPLGVYAVTGNHDHWAGQQQIVAAIEAAGIPVLENRSIRLQHGGRTIWLVGIGDYFSDADNPSRALAGVPRDRTALCLTHSPDVFPELPSKCALTIAGHTHGGQVWLPIAGRLIVPSHYGQRYAAGLIRENDKTLFVSTGIGTSIIPVRFLVPPEISILDIRTR